MAEQFRVATMGKPRGEWRDSYDAALKDAIRLDLASWDQSKREWFIAVPVSIEKRGHRDHPEPGRRIRHRSGWTDDDIAYLRSLAVKERDWGIIAVRLGRTREAVNTKARQLGITLQPART